MNMPVTAIIVAGGKGTRMGAPVRKQYLLLDQRPIICHTLQVFSTSGLLDQLILVVPPDDILYCQTDILPRVDRSGTIQVVAGGAERQDSVYQGLLAVQKQDGVVLIHDGVRPFVETDQIRKLIEGAQKHGACIPAITASDTVKQVDPEGCVQQTLDRSRICLAQTPQAFLYPVIRKAHDDARQHRVAGTDDASLVERINAKVLVIPGRRRNIKITTPEDLAWAAGLVSGNGGRSEV